MKKILSIAILALFILGVCTGLASAQNNGKANQQGKWNKASVRNVDQEYNDMQGEWSREAVMYATALGAVEGWDGAFRPNQPLTHLEAIAMLVKAELGDDTEDYDITDTTIEFFQDEKVLKKIPEWGKIFVEAAYQEGIILPDELKKFNPQQGIKRYEVCIYLSRINGDTTVVPQTKKEFKDWADISEEYRGIVRNVHNKGLVNGDEGKFFPNQIVKRCEMAVILGNLEDNVLHSKTVTGILKDATEPDADGEYTIQIKLGDTIKEFKADEDTKVYSNGEEVDIEDIVDSRVRLIVRDNQAVLIRVIPEDTDDDSYKVEGILTNVAEADDEDADYILTVDTEEDGDVEITVDAVTVIKYNGHEIDIDDLEEFETYEDLQVEVTVDDDEAILVKIIPEDD